MNMFITVLVPGLFGWSAALAAETDGAIVPERLLELIESGDPPVVLDTRSRVEYDHGHVPGAVHFPFWKSFWAAGDLAYAKTDPLVVYCEHGPRASVARFALERHGYGNVMTLDGHMTGWKKAGLPVETAAGD